MFSAVYVLCIWQVVQAVSIQCGQVQRNVGWDSVNTDVYTRHVGVQVWNMCFPCYEICSGKHFHDMEVVRVSDRALTSPSLKVLVQ